MTKEEYFGDWLRVIPEKEFREVLAKIPKTNICPEYKYIFKAFNKCPYKDLRLVIIGQDSYPQKDVATGIAFANKRDTSEENLSPSLKILRNSMINLEMPNNFTNFVPDLEYLAEQGVLLINAALTCEVNKIGSHINIWRPFITKLVHNISMYNPGVIFVLLGETAQTLEPYIAKNCHIFKEKHPAYYARTDTRMPSTIWSEINDILISQNGYGIIFK